MKTTILAVSIMAILATGVIAPALQEAYAAAPGYHGEKTKLRMPNTDSYSKTQQGEFDGIKKETVKINKKTIENHKALQIIKSLYNLG